MVRSPALLATLAAAALLAACGTSRMVEDEAASETHPAGFADPVLHGPAALGNLDGCQTCHGVDYDGGRGPSCTDCHETHGYPNWTANCTFCHGTEQVQVYTAADLPKAAPDTGAHLGHVNKGLDCSECHPPATVPAHVDGLTAVPFGALARTGGLTPQWTAPTCSSVYCHGAGLVNGGGSDTTPEWTAGALACSTCHDYPPPTSHPGAPLNGHDFHVAIIGPSNSCTPCHVGSSDTSGGPNHVNGVGEYRDQAGVDRTDGWDGVPTLSATSTGVCSGCHGD